MGDDTTIRKLRNPRPFIGCEHCGKKPATHLVGSFAFFTCDQHKTLSVKTLAADYERNHGCRKGAVLDAIQKG